MFVSSSGSHPSSSALKRAASVVSSATRRAARVFEQWRPAPHAGPAGWLAIVLLAVCTLPALAPAPASAQAPRTRGLIVGTKAAPPFVELAPDGSWTGLSIELWEAIADSLGMEYRYEERDLPGLFQGVEDGSLNLAVAAITVTPERERLFDFTHPFQTTGLAIAVQRGTGMGWTGALSRVLSRQFLTVMLSLVLLLLVFGFLVWIFERRHNPEQFGGTPAHGIGAGFWWAAVTMTTVGYGDKAPVTPGGRILGLVWMFTAIVIISGFTAAMASALTASQLEGRIRGPEDLVGARVGTVQATSSATYLEGRGIPFRRMTDLPQALEALAAGDVDAVVYDAPILRYTCRGEYPTRLEMVPGTFTRQDYAILLRSGSELREPTNEALLGVIQSNWWQETVLRYVGR